MEQVSSEQEYLNQRSLTQIEESPSFLRLKIYSSLARSKTQVIILHDKFQLKKQLQVKEASAIFINRQTSQTKMIHIPNDSLSKNKLNIDEEGCTLLVQIFPKIVKNNCQSFDIARSNEQPIKNEKDLVSNTFIVLKSLGSNKLRKMKLRDKDIIKLGREAYEVLLNKEGGTPKWFDKVYHQQQILPGACRICLCQQATHPEDYLISPCSCSGSCALIHIQCLRKWISNRVIKRQNSDIKTLNLKKLSCEICKSDFPKYVSIDGRMIELAPLFVEKGFLILQKIDFEGKEKIIHCINIEKNLQRPIFIGRNQANELILQDMSISRIHAKLTITKEGIHLYDCNSKFGTFVMLKSHLINLKGVTLMSNKWTFQLNTNDSL